MEILKDDPERNQNRDRLELAIKARDLEIDLFWKRSFFFWGFIGAALIAFGSLSVARPFIAFMISGFGFACSVVWTLANRGSKYWFESWEQKVHDTERLVVGVLFGKPEPVQRPGEWLSGKRFSVSRLAIALSDYCASLWLLMFVAQGVRVAVPVAMPTGAVTGGVILFAMFTFGFVVAAYRKCSVN